MGLGARQLSAHKTDDYSRLGTDEMRDTSHSLRLGFNVGYLSDSQYYAKAFRRIAADGITHTRFMGPFLHPQGSAAGRREAFVTALIANVSKLMGAASTITLSLSDFPFGSPPSCVIAARVALQRARRGHGQVRGVDLTQHFLFPPDVKPDLLEHPSQYLSIWPVDPSPHLSVLHGARGTCSSLPHGCFSSAQKSC